MTTITYNFDNMANYEYDSDKFKVVGGVLSLKQEEIDTDYTENFTSDSGFTYDSAKAEFSGGNVQQKLQVSSNLVGAATFTSNKDLNYITSGSTTGTYIDAPTISDGRLVCSANTTAKGVYYTSSAIGAVASTFSINFKYRPAYSGTPTPNSMAMVSLQHPSGTANNRFMLYHSNSSGFVRYNINNDAGTSISFGTAIDGVFNPTAGTEYEVEVCVDTANGILYLFIDGTLKGSSVFTAFTRGTSATRLSIGSDVLGYNCHADFAHGILYNNVQHTTSYTAGYNPPEYNYASSIITLPMMEHLTDGTFKAFNSLTTTEAGSPRYTLQIDESGDDLYHDGSSWVASNGTYAQSSAEAAFNTYASSLGINGATSGIFKIYFPDATTQSSVDVLTASVKEDGDYPTDNPSIYSKTPFRCTDISSIVTDPSTITGGEIKVVMNRNGTDYYYDTVGEAWAESSGYSESNSISELTEAILDEINNGNRYTVYPKLFFHSADGSASPTLESYSATFDFALADPVTPNVINVEYFIHSNNAPVVGLVPQVRPYESGYWNEGIFIEYAWQNLGATDDDGYGYGDVYLQGEGKYWEIKIGKQRYKVQLNDVTDMDLKDAPYWELISEE